MEVRRAALPPGLRFAQVSCGWLHSLAVHVLALRSDGEVIAWGPGMAGELDVPPLLPGLSYVEAIPSNASLIDLPMHVQAVVSDPLANPLGVVTSDAATVRFGD